MEASDSPDEFWAELTEANMRSLGHVDMDAVFGRLLKLKITTIVKDDSYPLRESLQMLADGAHKELPERVAAEMQHVPPLLNPADYDADTLLDAVDAAKDPDQLFVNALSEWNRGKELLASVSAVAEKKEAATRDAAHWTDRYDLLLAAITTQASVPEVCELWTRLDVDTLAMPMESTYHIQTRLRDKIHDIRDKMSSYVLGRFAGHMKVTFSGQPLIAHTQRKSSTSASPLAD